MHDVLIRNALVLDGGDRPGRHGDVAIRDGRIVAVGAVPGAARQVIDADG
ncbi:MAG TPA: D-aminoacylase, partial [Stenotrophomonas sp.]|nr:D-aminoacylase [Stenotrophomonas sp.]